MLRYQRRRIQCVFGAVCVWIGVALTSAQGPAPLSPAALRDMAASHTSSLKTVPVVDAQGFDQFVRDRGALRAALGAGGIAFSVRMDATIVAPQTAMGATLVFE